MAHSREALALLLVTARGSVDVDIATARSCIQQAAAMLDIDLSVRSEATQLPVRNGGLAPWQATLIRSHIESNLSSKIRTTDLAASVQLSTRHFFRTFRHTFGETPGDYIVKQRMLLSQHLMLHSRFSLGQIALEAGMCDQAHFSRTFRRIVGATPGAWRRGLRALSGATDDRRMGGCARARGLSTRSGFHGGPTGSTQSDNRPYAWYPSGHA
jgi:AraC family transcriptional regulator